MSEFAPSTTQISEPLARSSPAIRPVPAVVAYAVTAAMVALAWALAFVVDDLIAAPNLTLIFVLPVVIAGASFGAGPSLSAAVAGVLAYAFLFIEPRMTFRIDDPADIWAAALLLITAGIVSGVAAQSRGRALEAQRAADQARAVQQLAHVIIDGAPRAAVFEAAAQALSRSFDAPAVVFEGPRMALAPAASAGGAHVTYADLEAARGALESGRPTRARAFPFEASGFDCWPIAAAAGPQLVLGVGFDGERPAAPERLVEVIAGYLAAAGRGRR